MLHGGGGTPPPIEVPRKCTSDIPVSGPSFNTVAILPTLLSAKLEPYRSMLEQDVGKAELAGRPSVHLPTDDRLLDLNHNSRFNLLERA